MTKRSTCSSKSSSSYKSAGCKDAVWSLAKKVAGSNPDVVRQDPYGKKIYYAKYGGSGSGHWHVDHIKPKNRGGSDHIRNLQALSSAINLSKGDALVKRDRHCQ